MSKQLQQVARKTEALERAEAALDDAIRVAHAAGASLRAIRDASGGRLSHESVRRTLAKTKGDSHAR